MSIFQVILAICLCLAPFRAARAAQPSLWLDGEVETRCPTLGQLLGALRQQLAPRGVELARGSERRPLVRVRETDAAGTSLRVTLSNPDGRVFKRTVQSSGECSELAQSIAFFVDAWMRELPLLPGAAAALPAHAATPAARPPGTLPPPPMPPEPTEAMRAADRADEEPELPKAPVAAPPPTQPAATVRASESGEGAPSRLAALLGIDGSVAASGGFFELAVSPEVDLRLSRRWGLDLSASFSGGGTHPLGDGAIQLTRDAVAVWLGWSWLISSPWVAELLFGPRLEFWNSSSQGFSGSIPQENVVFAVDALARGRVDLSRLWFAWLALQLTVATERTEFTVYGVGSVITPVITPYLWLTGSAGVGFNFF